MSFQKDTGDPSGIRICPLFLGTMRKLPLNPHLRAFKAILFQVPSPAFWLPWMPMDKWMLVASRCGKAETEFILWFPEYFFKREVLFSYPFLKLLLLNLFYWCRVVKSLRFMGSGPSCDCILGGWAEPLYINHYNPLRSYVVLQLLKVLCYQFPKV